MKIAVDAMGGDHAPGAVVRGAVRAAAGGVDLVLVGDREAVEAELAHCGAEAEAVADRLEVVHTDERVAMDEPATTPVRRKPRASVRLCAELVHDGRAAAMFTAGNTGAAMVCAKMVLGTVPGVDRPALAAVLPNRHGRTVLLDVGANVDAKPSYLRQFAVMGHAYAQVILGASAPRIGLLSIGEEEEKGSDLVREVHKVLKTTGLNFVGNVEGGDVFSGAVDVVVTDGFVGNVVLKSAESLVELAVSMLREELARTSRSRLGYALAKEGFDRFRLRTDYREQGVAPLLGVEGGCFIAHGRSGARAVNSALRTAAEFAAARLHGEIRDLVAELHSQEERLFGALPGGTDEPARRVHAG